MALSLGPLNGSLDGDRLFAALFERGPYPMWMYDVDTLQILDVNGTAIDQYGYERAEFIGLSVADLVPYEDAHAFLKGIPTAANQYSDVGVWRHRTKHGTIFDVTLFSSTLRYHGRDIRCVTAIDAERTSDALSPGCGDGPFSLAEHLARVNKMVEERLTQLAYFDSLTGLPNRTWMERILSEAIERADIDGTRLGVIILDIDRFTDVNDSLGQGAGDQLLVQAAQRLKKLTNDQRILARSGPDELLLALEGIADIDECASLANEVLNTFQEPFTIGNERYFITASVGACVYPDLATSAPSLVRSADTATYRARRLGGAQVAIYSKDQQVEATKRLHMETGLRRALGRGEFAVHYQPIVAADSANVHSFEALLRWEHPRLGMIYPQEFIPLAEETALVVPIGEWVLSEVCKQIADWNVADNGPLRVSVNVSGRQLEDPRFSGNLRDIVAAAGIDPHMLQLELTESALLRRGGVTAANLDRLHDMGIHLAIDDFGTGYSSLAYVKELPIRVLKIDRAFISQIADNHLDRALVEAIIGIANKLQIEVVAEGVETLDQMKMLQSLNCDRLQGFYFGKAIPIADLGGFMEDHHRARNTKRIH